MCGLAYSTAVEYSVWFFICEQLWVCDRLSSSPFHQRTQRFVVFARTQTVSLQCILNGISPSTDVLSSLSLSLDGNKTVRSHSRDAMVHYIASTIGTASLVASVEMRWDGKGIAWRNESCIRRRPRDASVHRCDGAETTWKDHLFCLHLTFFRRVSVRACLTRIVFRVYLPTVFSNVFHLSFGILLSVCVVRLHLARRAHIHTVNAWIIAYCVSIYTHNSSESANQNEKHKKIEWNGIICVMRSALCIRLNIFYSASWRRRRVKFRTISFIQKRQVQFPLHRKIFVSLTRCRIGFCINAYSMGLSSAVLQITFTWILGHIGHL